jgi:hypothetical protein
MLLRNRALSLKIPAGHGSRAPGKRISTMAVVLITAAIEWAVLTRADRQGFGTWLEPTPGGALSGAGYWYMCVGLPIYQFVLVRWGYRLLVWARFLNKIVGLDLLLMPPHPLDFR